MSKRLDFTAGWADLQPEIRMWRAVILQTWVDAEYGSRRNKAEARMFLLQTNDYVANWRKHICRCANVSEDELYDAAYAAFVDCVDSESIV